MDFGFFKAMMRNTSLPITHHRISLYKTHSHDLFIKSHTQKLLL